jgi:hypothetical protein
MLQLLRDRASDRKLRLWACACARHRYSPGLVCVDEAVPMAERWADEGLPEDLGPLSRFYVCMRDAWVAADEGTVQLVARTVDRRELPAEKRFLAATLQCVFGNPFHPISFSPSWHTDTTVALARQMYESRDFGAMPILADALQDAGCDSEDILNHCRGEGPHVRGCWVADLVLGKE